MREWDGEMFVSVAQRSVSVQKTTSGLLQRFLWYWGLWWNAAYVCKKLIVNYWKYRCSLYFGEPYMSEMTKPYIIFELRDLIIILICWFWQMLHCQVCCEPFHRFCLEPAERPSDENKENWCCRRCRFCHVCGRKNKNSKVIWFCFSFCTYMYFLAVV